MNIYTQDYYVYFYLRSDFTPYYIGKGKGRRAWTVHKNIGVPKDKTKIIIVESNITELQAFMLERYYIRWFGRKYTNTGILRNITEGGEGGPVLKGKLNGMYGKTHTKEVKKILSEKAKKNKGKSYEEIYGVKKAEKLKQIRSEAFKGKNNTKENNPRYDNTIYTFNNKETNETFIGTRFDFYTKYSLNKSSVFCLIKKRNSHKGWVIVDQI
jgi:hypothetical protein